MLTLSRRGLLGPLLMAPAIIRTPGLLMRIKPLAPVKFTGTLTFGETVFHLDAIDESPLDFSYLLPMTKIEMYSQSLYFPHVVAALRSPSC